MILPPADMIRRALLAVAIGGGIAACSPASTSASGDAGYDYPDPAPLDAGDAGGEPCPWRFTKPQGDPGSDGGTGADGWLFASGPPGMVRRRLGSGYRTIGRRLAADASGRISLLWMSYENPESSMPTAHLDEFDAQGRQVGSVALPGEPPTDFVRHEDGTFTTWRIQCGERNDSTCFTFHEGAQPALPTVWAPRRRRFTTYQIDAAGEVARSVERWEERRHLVRAETLGSQLLALTNEGQYMLHRLTRDGAVLWSVPLLPSVTPADIEPDAPLEEILNATALVTQSVAGPVVTARTTVVAAAVTRGTLTALRAERGVQLPLPQDPRCADVLIAEVNNDGSGARFWSIPTPTCESLPQVTVVENSVVVASVVPTAIDPQPNDTEQYDIGLGILDLSSGRVTADLRISLREDDWVQALVPCGAGDVCLVGSTGARSVDTGSTVSFGDGLLLRMSVEGELLDQWTLSSPRHTVITHVTPGVFSGAPAFFATWNGPITHTADSDPTLAFNHGTLGVLSDLCGVGDWRKSSR